MESLLWDVGISFVHIYGLEVRCCCEAERDLWCNIWSWIVWLTFVYMLMKETDLPKMCFVQRVKGGKCGGGGGGGGWSSTFKLPLWTYWVGILVMIYSFWLVISQLCKHVYCGPDRKKYLWLVWCTVVYMVFDWDGLACWNDIHLGGQHTHFW